MLSKAAVVRSYMRPSLGSMLGRLCRLCPRAVSHEMDEAKRAYTRALEKFTEAEYIEASP